MRWTRVKNIHGENWETFGTLYWLVLLLDNNYLLCIKHWEYTVEKMQSLLLSNSLCSEGEDTNKKISMSYVPQKTYFYGIIGIKKEL
jgi:hypothetical protein